MTGATIAIEDASATDTILSVKERLFAANRKLPVRRQRLIYRPGPRGMEPLADDDTLGGAGVAHDGTAELDVLLVELPAADAAKLGPEVWRRLSILCVVFVSALQPFARTLLFCRPLHGFFRLTSCTRVLNCMWQSSVTARRPERSCADRA